MMRLRPTSAGCIIPVPFSIRVGRAAIDLRRGKRTVAWDKNKKDVGIFFEYKCTEFNADVDRVAVDEKDCLLIVGEMVNVDIILYVGFQNVAHPLRN